MLGLVYIEQCYILVLGFHMVMHLVHSKCCGCLRNSLLSADRSGHRNRRNSEAGTHSLSPHSTAQQSLPQHNCLLHVM